MIAADDWPTFAEELGRKSLTVVEKWMKAHEAGKITRKELFILVSGVYDTISGLAPKADANVIANVFEEIRRAKS